MVPPGVMLVWSGVTPVFRTFRIPPEGLVLGRAMNEGLDDRISARHARLEVMRGELVCTDLDSRNGTWVGGHAIIKKPVSHPFPAVLRTGRTVWIAVADIAPYEGTRETRRGTAVIRASLVEPCKQVDAAADAGKSIALIGSRGVGRALANSYADRRREQAGWFDGATGSLAKVLGKKPGVLCLDVVGTLKPADHEKLSEVVGTMPIVTLARTSGWIRERGPKIAAALSARMIEIPWPRLDELTSTLVDLVDSLAPGAEIHATAIELGLLRASELPEDDLLRAFASSVTGWRREGFAQLRGEDIIDHDPFEISQRVVVLPLHRKERKRRQVRKKATSIGPLTVSWETRRLCTDGSCIGVIGADGVCKVCGTPMQSDGPYR